jgi:hypothetical protein
MIQETLARLESKLDAFMGSLPEFMPITSRTAKDLGYARSDTLLKAARRELEPDVEIVRDGSHYAIKVSSLWKVKR